MQKDLEQIFPTRPSLKLNDFSSNMGWRYVTALIKLMRMDRMRRTDALSLTLKLSCNDDVSSTKSLESNHEINSNNKIEDNVSPNLMRMCSLLPDGREYRVNYAESLKEARGDEVNTKKLSLDADQKKPKLLSNKAVAKIKEIIPNLPVSGVNSGRATATTASVANRSTALISSDRPDDSSKASVAIDVNFGQYIHTLHHNSGDNQLDEGSSDLIWGGIIPIRPTSEKGSSRPVIGGRVMVSDSDTKINNDGDIKNKRIHQYGNSGHKKATVDAEVSKSATLVQNLSVELVIKEASIKNKASKSLGSPKKKGKNGIDPEYLPTAGDIARTMIEANNSPQKRRNRAFLLSHSDITSMESLKNAKSKSIQVFNDLVVVFNIRQEESEGEYYR